MSVNCDRLQDQYSDYFENTLSPLEVADFERHLATCSSCRSDYHVFATMFQFLDRIDVTEVEAPTNLRAEILTQINKKPEVKKQSAVEWLGGIFSIPQVAWGSGLAVAAAAVIGVVAVVHPQQKTPPPAAVVGSFGVNAAAPVANIVPPLIQTVVLKQGSDGSNYEYFFLHIPVNVTSSASINAYVLQDGSPLANAALESDTTKASPAWSGPIEPNVSLSLPVSVTSDVPPGGTLNLLVDWTPKDGSSTGGREVAFVPINVAPTATTAVPSSTSFYDALSQISGEYHQTVVADTSALAAFPKFASFSGTTGNELTAEDALNSELGQSGFTVSPQPGGYYLVSYN